MNREILYIGAGLEMVYLLWMISLSSPSLSPMFVELSKHVVFQVVVLTILLIGAFKGGK